MDKIGYGGGVPLSQFYAPAFLWTSKGKPEPNYIVLRNASFAAPTPEQATVLGHLADLSGFTRPYGLEWQGDWVLITMSSGPFALGSIRDWTDPSKPEMSIAVIKGPILDQAIKASNP